MPDVPAINPVQLPPLRLPAFDPPPADFTARMVTFTRAVNRMAEDVRRALEQTGRTLARMGESIRAAANDPVHVAGLEATYAVRAGLNFDLTTLPVLVQSIMRGSGHYDHPTVLLTRENRARVAAAAVRGYVVGNDRYNDQPRPVRRIETTYGIRYGHLVLTTILDRRPA